MATRKPTRSATPEEIRAAFSYDPRTGEIVRKSDGAPVGAVNERGYVYLCFKGSNYFAHRVAWCLATGSWPKHQIDHINGIKDDNRLRNLRDVTGLVNAQNMHKAKKNNACGRLNVSRYKSGAYIARIYRNGDRLYLGSFRTAEEAERAVKMAENYPSTSARGPNKVG